MKQIIEKYNGKIEYKYYVNHLNQLNGIHIGYRINSSISYKCNWINGKKIGLDNWYENNGKLEKIIYYL